MKRRLGSMFYTVKPRKDEMFKKRWNVASILLKILKKTCMALGAFVLFFVVLSAVGLFFVDKEAEVEIPQNMVLVYNMDKPLPETLAPPSLAAPFESSHITAQNFIDSLNTASKDKRVHGLVVKLNSAGIELNHIQEIRKALKDFKKSGKFAYIYAPSFSELGSGIGAYYLAAAFDEIWMQPVGFLSVTGLSLEMPFARGLLDKVGVTPEFLHREEYKSAMESFTNTSMSPANREMMQSILNELSGQILNDVAMDRKIPAKTLQSYINQGLFTGQDALKAGLITHLNYYDVLSDKLDQKILGERDKTHSLQVTLEDYYDVVVQKYEDNKKGNVALVSIDGEIVAGEDQETGYATGDYIAKAILQAAEDDDIKVIVLRVNSPGGSPVASETIRRAINIAKGNGKKIVVSMGALAASGGYWVCVDADKIYALPTTITGSIGVIMGKFAIADLWKKLGVNWDGMSWGDNAKLWSVNDAMTQAHRAVLNNAIDSTYQDFIARVAHGRKMDEQRVRSLAKGRAWTGSQAVKLGLVDELGGLDDALDSAAHMLGKKDRSEISLLVLPKPLTPFEQLMALMGEEVRAGRFDFGAYNGLFKLFDSAKAVERSGFIQTYDADASYIH